MSDFIPGDQLATFGVVRASLSETVESVRQKLVDLNEHAQDLVLGTHAQYNAPILIRLPDNRIAPTSAPMLRKLAQVEGPPILERQLGDLLDELCPEPWSVESQGPGYREASAAASARQLPVIVTEEGQPVGLMQPSGDRVVKPAYSKDKTLFDLFDDPLPREALAQTQFVAVAAGATPAKVAKELRELTDAEGAYIVVEQEDDFFQVVAVRDLNREVEKGSREVWATPLRAFPSLLRTAESRQFGTVGKKQAQALAKAENFLVLTDQGEPTGLLPSPEVVRGGHLQALPTYSTPGPPPAPNLLTATDEDLEEFAEEVEAETEGRFVNLWFTDSAGRTRARSQALERDEPYLLRVNIGRRSEESIIKGRQPPVREPPKETPKGTKLYVALFWDKTEFDIPNPTQPLWLPPHGDSSFVEFKVTPRRRSLGAEDKSTLDVHIYYHCNAVQSWRVRVEVVRQGQKAQSDSPQEPILLADRTEDYVSLEEIGPRQLSLTIDKAPGDGYWFDFVVAKDGQSDGIRLSCRVNLRREDLTHLITKTRRQLYSITRSKAYQEAVSGSALIQVKAKRALALLGRQLYNRLFKLEGPESSASQVGDWITGTLVEGSKLQVIDRARDFVFPWSLVYDGVPWDRDGLAKQVDIGGFWGYRYQIELLTEELIQTSKAKGKEVDTSAGLHIGVGLNEEIPWSKEQRGFFGELSAECGKGADYFFFDTSPQLTDFLEKGDRHLFYVFCHGFTERMATDIQIEDNLLGEFKTWLNTLSEDERKKFEKQEEDQFFVSDSWIKLTYGTVPLTMMEHYAAPRLDFAPLVFLNMCESAQVLPSLSGGFIPFFLKHGARGVIGTECPMTSTFADPFARDFFRLFLEAQPVGMILWNLRRDYLEKGNPLGLAYTLYGDADTKLSKAIL